MHDRLSVSVKEDGGGEKVKLRNWQAASVTLNEPVEVDGVKGTEFSLADGFQMWACVWSDDDWRDFTIRRGPSPVTHVDPMNVKAWVPIEA